VNADLPDRLETSLLALSQGADLASALPQDPAAAEALRPALEAALALRSLLVGGPANAARARSRARLLSELERPARPRLAAWILALPRQAIAIAALAIALSLTVGGLDIASAQALPGDPLYPVKIAGEELRVRLSLSSRARTDLRRRYTVRRSDEVRRLIELGRIATVSFPGTVESTELNLWRVSGIPVLVTSATDVAASIQPGMGVEIDGQTRPEGYLLAERIRLVSFYVSGRISVMGPTMWRIAGEDIRVVPSTTLDPSLTVGDWARARVAVDPDGSWTAESIDRISPPPTATPNPSPTPAATATAGLPDHSGPSPDGSEEPDDDDGGGDDDNSGPGGGDGGDEGDEGGDSGGGSEESDDSGGDEEEDLEVVKIEGVLQSQSGAVWVVNGIAFLVDGETEIKDNPQVGEAVKVEALRYPDGTLVATKVEVDD
jgi:hypothetical protein